MKFFSKILVCACLVTFAGCPNGGDNNEVMKMQYDPGANIKELLGSVKTSGRLGSSFSQVIAAVRDLKKADPAKGDSIEKLINELAALSDPAKVKAKADEIIKLL